MISYCMCRFVVLLWHSCSCLVFRYLLVVVRSMNLYLTVIYIYIYKQGHFFPLLSSSTSLILGSNFTSSILMSLNY